MRQKKETATSFDKLKEITQAIRALKNCAQTSDNANTSEPTSQSTPKHNGSAHANTSEPTSQSTLKHNGTLHAKNIALKPTKKAFSERQRTTIRDNSQASVKETKGVTNA
ncbi:hypothetical protein Kyoto98A_03540 [Helicobacter pylori]